MNARPLILLSLLISVSLLLTLVLSGTQPTAAQSREEPFRAPDRVPATAALRGAPVMFIENVGQFDAEPRFQLPGGDHTLWLAQDALWINLREPGSQVEQASVFNPAIENPEPVDQNHRGVNLKLSFDGANPHPLIEPYQRLETHVSYLTGNRPQDWHTDVPVWGGVRYVDLYPGVDLEISGQNGEWSWRLVVKDDDTLERHELENLRLRVDGAVALTLENAGDADSPTHIRLTTATSDLTLPLLDVVSADGESLDIAASRPWLDGDQISAPFSASLSNPAGDESFDTSASTASDLRYATFLGGTDFDNGKGVAVDASGAAYVTGYAGHDFPTTPGAYDTTFGGDNYDAFVAKISADGSSAPYVTFLGGSGDDIGHAIAVKDDGTAAYVIGHTYSANFPTTGGAFLSGYAGGSDAFIAQLNADGTGLVYATFLGGSGWEEGRSIATDDGGAAYVIGTTKSNDFPTTLGAYNKNYNGTQDVFVAKLNASGGDLIYASYLGGDRWDWGYDIAVDASGAAYVTGDTYGYGFPTTPGAFDTTFSGEYEDAFVAKFSSDGSQLLYCTLLSGSSGFVVRSTGLGIAVDGSGTAYVVGRTSSDDFPTTAGAFQTNRGGGYDPFVVRLNADASDLLYSTYLGGSDHDVAFELVLDGGLVYVTGETGSTDLPTTAGALQPTLASDWYSWYDAFVAVLNPEGKGADDLLYATYLGGTEDDRGDDIALHAGSRTIYVAGFTVSEDFPTTVGAYDTSYGGGVYGQEPYGDAFVVRLEPYLPQVSSVEPCIGGPFYFRPWPTSASNDYQAQLDWRGHTPAYVDFVLNGDTARENASGDTASHAFDLGNLAYGLLGTRNTLAVQAVTADGFASPPYMLYPIGVENPAWLPVGNMQQEIPSGCSGQPMKTKWDIPFPDPPFEANVTPPSWLPFIGGSPFGIKRTQAGLEVEFASNGDGSAKLYGQTGFDASEQEVTGRVFGQGTGTIGEGEGARLQGATFGLELEGAVKAERPLVDVICQAVSGGTCPLKQAEQLPVVGGAVRWFNERAKFEATVQPGLQLAFNFASDESGLQWESGTGTVKVKLTLALILDAIKDILTAEGYGGGEPHLTLQTPPDPSYLKEVKAKILAGVKLKVWRWEQTFEAPYEWSYSPSESSALATAEGSGFLPLRATGWHPIPRDYAADPANYARFRANDRSPLSAASLAASNSTIGALAAGEDAIATNVFPDGHPAIASDGNLLLLWVHDDTGKPLMQGEEIYFSVYSGTNWSAPAGITADNYQDFAPQVVFDSNEDAIAVWERNEVLQSESSEFDADYANAFELAYSVWSSSTQTWSPPTYLTDNSALDHAPVLARGNDGVPSLVWRQNAAGELMGTITHTDVLSHTIWDGAAWITPTTLLTGGSGILGLTTARHDASTMSIVYSLDADGDLSTDGDQELYRLTWNGSAWSGPTRLTDDAEPDNQPTLFYDPSGNPRLLWLKGDTLYALLGSWTGTPQAVAVQGSATVLDYAAAQDDAGNLVLLWQGYSDDGVDIFYAVYDQAHSVFSQVEQLTKDESLEKFMAPAFAPTGEMVVAFNKTALTTQTVTVSSTLVISNVTTFGQTDLHVLRHTLGPDLALEATDLAVDPVNPTPGSTARISATLHNAGDQAVVNPQVAFYQGDPAVGGTLIGTDTASLTLAGGTTTTLIVDWSVPAGGGPFAIYAIVDPDGSVAELNETNNEAHFYVAVPDLVVDDLQVDYGSSQVVTLTATVNNAGVVAAAPVTVVFRLDDPTNGTIVAQANAPSLAAGTQAELADVWDVTSTTTGRYTMFAVADPEDVLVEADETNNSRAADVGVLPDLILRSTAVVTGHTPGGNLVASVWVFNEGLRDANGVALGIYDRLPNTGSTPLVSSTLDIGAGEHRVATLDLGQYPWPGFYVGVGISGEVDDRDTNDNLLLLGQALPNRLYLPLVLRNY